MQTFISWCIPRLIGLAILVELLGMADMLSKRTTGMLMVILGILLLIIAVYSYTQNKSTPSE